MTAPHTPTPQSPPPGDAKGRTLSLVLAVAIAAVGGFVLARLGGESAAPSPASPRPDAPRVVNIPPALAAQVGALRPRIQPNAQVIEALHAAQAARSQPAAMQAAPVPGQALGAGGSPSPEQLDHLAAQLRPRLDDCAARTFGRKEHPKLRLELQGTVEDDPSRGQVWTHVELRSFEPEVPRAPAFGECASNALEGAPVGGAGLLGQQRVSMHFDL